MVETMYLNFWLAVDGTQTGVKMSWKDHKQQLGALAVLQRLLHDCAIHIGQDPSQAENLQELEGQLHVLREMERSIAVKSNTARRPPIHPLMQASADAASSAGAQGSKSESDEVQPARSHRFSGSNSHFVSELHAALEEVKKAGLADMDEEEALVAPADTSELLECSDGRDDFRDEPGADFNALAQLIQQTRSSDRMVHRRVGHLLSPRTLPPRLYSIEEGDEDEGNSPRHAARATSTTGGSQIPGSRLKPPQGPPPAKRSPVVRRNTVGS